jgi:hypothetical protein
MIMIGANFKTKVIMKKTLFFLMSLCALTISSCMKEENPEISGETYTYTFNGTAGPETKVSVGDKTEEGWPIKWTGGDVISVFKTSDSEQLGSAKLVSESAGKTHGTFAMTATVSHEGEVLIAHGSSLTYADGTISGGMLPKIESCEDAIRQGVKKVHLVDGRMAHSLLLEIFTREGVGTEITE